MPPVKKLPKPKGEEHAESVLVMFLRNLEEMRRWYRNASGSGNETGHIVMSELNLANIATALELALQDKSWEPPAHNP